MRQVIALVLVLGGFASSTAAFQTRAGASGGNARIGACSLLPQELVEKYFQNKKLFPSMKPSEQPMGPKGSTCDYGSIHLQVDPFANPDVLRKEAAKPGYEKVAGVGDEAYFHNNKDRFAELVVWTGAHHFTIQMDINTGKTAATTNPDTIAVANAIIPKLQ
jgi:hypothetical protein